MKKEDWSLVGFLVSAANASYKYYIGSKFTVALMMLSILFLAFFIVEEISKKIKN